MEISLSAELMELFEKIVGIFTRVQFQYLVIIIPTVFMVLVLVGALGRPFIRWIKRKLFTRRFERVSKTAVVSLVHPSTPTSIFDLLNLPLITLDDSQKLLRALHKDIPKTMPITLILHTPGGLVIAAEQIARAIQGRWGKVSAYIPQYAMSGGTLIALACDEIYMGENALLGPLDPQLSIGMFEIYPAASIIRASEAANEHRDDKTLILADISRKAVVQMKNTVVDILKDKMSMGKANDLAEMLCSGNWTHDYGIDIHKALELGLPVRAGMPREIDQIMTTFSCPSSVSYGKKKVKDNGLIQVHL